MLYSLSEQAKTIPISVHSFLSKMTIGEMRVPEEFLLPFEHSMTNASFGDSRKLTPARLIPGIKDDPEKLSIAVEAQKREMTLLISAFVISKVLASDIFINRHTIDVVFDELPKSEHMYFHFYGMTLVALLTDLIFKRFGIQLLDNENEDKSSAQVKQELFQDLLDPANGSTKNLNYSQFKYSPER